MHSLFCSLSELYERAKAAKQQQDNYKDAAFFVLFAALYFAVLYLQAGAAGTYKLNAAHQSVIPPVSCVAPALSTVPPAVSTVLPACDLSPLL